MKIYMMAAAAAMLITTSASAGSHNPAIKDPTVATTQLAAKSRNSFTESQAQGRITPPLTMSATIERYRHVPIFGAMY